MVEPSFSLEPKLIENFGFLKWKTNDNKKGITKVTTEDILKCLEKKGKPIKLCDINKINRLCQKSKTPV